MVYPYFCISEQQCQSHPIKDGERFARSPSFIIQGVVSFLKQPLELLFIHIIHNSVPVIAAEKMCAFTGAEPYPALVQILGFKEI